MYHTSFLFDTSKMLEVPKHILQKLICTHCGDYLSHGPVMLNKQNEQICGRCFKILPEQAKSECIREIGLEAVAELLIFPCRYNEQGCEHTFPWNSGGDHEIKCPYARNTLPLEECLLLDNNNTGSTYNSRSMKESESEEVHMKVSCDNEYNIYSIGEEKLRLKVELAGRDGCKLSVTNYATNQVRQNVVLGCEIFVSLETSKITSSYVTVKDQIEEHLYEKVPTPQPSLTCATCNKVIPNLEIFHCPFGHTICRQCKLNSCKICGNLPQADSQYYCKNFVAGCKLLLPAQDIKKHEIDCEFNYYKCPLYEECDYCDSLNNLNFHFTQAHPNRVICSKELIAALGRKDQNWYLYCFDRLFHCKYFYLEDSVEFIVKYIGSNDNASNYRYYVQLKFEDSKVLKKNEKCLGWNQIALGKGVSFDVGDTVRKKFEVHLSILSV